MQDFGYLGRSAQGRCDWLHYGPNRVEESARSQTGRGFRSSSFLGAPLATQEKRHPRSLDNAECEGLPARFRPDCDTAVIREAKIGIPWAANTEF